jgi:hypothetical protein
MEIIKLPGQKRIIMIFEGGDARLAQDLHGWPPASDGRALNPTYRGYSVGHWEDDTLVVDIVGFNEQTWLDYFGHPYTDMLHVVEKYSRPNKRTLHYEALIDDPGHEAVQRQVGTFPGTPRASSPSTSVRRTTNICNG